jgi:hypothetical protein
MRYLAIRPDSSYVKLGNHPMARSIRELDISEKPFMSFYYPERTAILPAGQVLENNVKSFEGYIGKNL